MGRVTIDKTIFDNVKRDVKIGLAKKTVAEYHGLSSETVRKINKSSSWSKWNKNKRTLNLEKAKSLSEVEIYYEEHNNWFINKLRKLAK